MSMVAPISATGAARAGARRRWRGRAPERGAGGRHGDRAGRRDPRVARAGRGRRRAAPSAPRSGWRWWRRSGFGDVLRRHGPRRRDRPSVPWALRRPARAARSRCWRSPRWRCGRRCHARAPSVGRLGVVGLLDLSANGLYALATDEGAASRGLGARLALPGGRPSCSRASCSRERVRRVQEVGIVLALAGVRARSAQADAEQRLEPRDRRLGVAVSTVAIPSAAAGLRLPGRSSTNTHALRRDADRARRRARRSPASACASRARRRSRRRRTARRSASGRSASSPHEFDTSPVRTPARRAARTASSIASSGCMPREQAVDQPRRARRRRASAAKRGSKSSSVIVPLLERRPSRSRAVGSSRKRSRTASGSSPSARQKAANDSKTLVVRTPPKSTSSPCVRQSPCAIRHARSATSGTPCVEQVEERVVGRARQRAACRSPRGRPPTSTAPASCTSARRDIERPERSS